MLPRFRPSQFFVSRFALILTVLILTAAASAQSTGVSHPSGGMNTAGGGVRIVAAPTGELGGSSGFPPCCINGIFPAPGATQGNNGFPPCCINGVFPVSPSNSPFFNRPLISPRHHHRDFDRGAAPLYVLPYYYYTPDFVEPVDDTMEEVPGPTIFDRRASSRSAAPPDRRYDDRLSRLERAMDEADTRPQPPSATSSSQPEADQPATVLVFRDGHKIEVRNYAIVGETVYDFTTERRRRIALTDLDLTATQKQNDDRGVDFRLPAHVSSN